MRMRKCVGEMLLLTTFLDRLCPLTIYNSRALKARFLADASANNLQRQRKRLREDERGLNSAAFGPKRATKLATGEI